ARAGGGTTSQSPAATEPARSERRVNKATTEAPWANPTPASARAARTCGLARCAQASMCSSTTIAIATRRTAAVAVVIQMARPHQTAVAPADADWGGQRGIAPGAPGAAACTAPLTPGG